MSGSWRAALGVVLGSAILGVILGVLMGVAWWALAPTEEWVKVEGGLGPAQLASSSWFGADGWFLVLGLIGGLILATLSWKWGRQRPVAMVVGAIAGAALLAVVAWSVGGLLGPPDPQSASADVPVGATVEGSLGLRAMGVLAAPVVASLALLVVLISLAPVRAAASADEAHEIDQPGAS